MFNITESVVDSLLDEVCRAEHMCCCEQCRMDVKAMALNNLPPKYVTSEQGRTYETFRVQELTQSRITIYQELLRAAQTVKERPHHNR